MEQGSHLLAWFGRVTCLCIKIGALGTDIPGGDIDHSIPAVVVRFHVGDAGQKIVGPGNFAFFHNKKPGLRRPGSDLEMILEDRIERYHPIDPGQDDASVCFASLR